mgnify:CR=1 FL=1
MGELCSSEPDRRSSKRLTSKARPYIIFPGADEQSSPLHYFSGADEQSSPLRYFFERLTSKARPYITSPPKKNGRLPKTVHIFSITYCYLFHQEHFSDARIIFTFHAVEIYTAGYRFLLIIFAIPADRVSSCCHFTIE